MVAAMQRQQGRAQALQAVALRTAAWGEAREFGQMLDRLNGVKPAAIRGEIDASLAAFGLRAECPPDAP